MEENGSEMKRPAQLEQMLRKTRRKQQKGQVDEEGKEEVKANPNSFGP